ncbi:MAG: type III-B CRISPR module RAMP protein Cmr1 [candidate division WOR-3 bacterium]|nr:type III-B CRISPR module RAMP protein Cmr1 [candidate division WOR-3 bacterium]
MNKITLKCRVITPMFMAGADGRTPEIRPSEFKGMMRWWWRAIKAEDDIDKLRKEENQIFGGTGEGGKSKVQIKINNKIDPSDIIDYQPLPHHKRNDCPVDKSQYCRKAFTSKAIKPGKEFEITFTYFDISTDIESLIYLVFTLGGFGKRSRRGFGSVEVEIVRSSSDGTKVDLPNILDKINKINNSYSIGNLSPNIQVIKNNKSSGASYPWIKEIILSGKAFNSYDEILEVIGLASHKHNDTSLGSANPRMASPVYVSVVKIDGKFYPIITVLNSAFPSRYPKYNLNKQQNFINDLL